MVLSSLALYSCWAVKHATKYNNQEKQTGFVGFEVLTVVTKKGTIFWYVTPYSLVKVHQRVRGIYSLHLQD
jgi:hypothetical protein